jgi:hypothetical protein
VKGLIRPVHQQGTLLIDVDASRKKMMPTKSSFSLMPNDALAPLQHGACHNAKGGTRHGPRTDQDRAHGGLLAMGYVVL